MKKLFSFLFCLYGLIVVLNAQTSTIIDTDLPLVMINTRGGVIVNDPKITADLSIVYNGLGKRNKSTDLANEYTGKVGIELRGQSSQGQPLRSYDIELRDEAGLEVHSPLIGMPPESDWVLYAPYMDKTMMRNYLAYTLTREMGRWASKVRYVELILNNEYQGIYLLAEKIKRDSSRVNISKLLPTDNEGIELTGGYIFSLDKEPNGWLSSYPNPFRNSGNISIRSKETQGIRLTVIAINGKTMTQTFKNVFRGDNNISLDASGWPAGIYQVILTTVTGEVYKYRMVKQ